MIDIVNELNEKNSENITKEKMWSRKCPKCLNEIFYSTKGNYTSSFKNNCLCRSCSNFLKRWKRNIPDKNYCKICDSEIHHKRTFCSSDCFDIFQRKTFNLCKWCKKFTSNKIFCSIDCLKEFKLKERSRYCLWCKGLITSYVSKNSKFCSRKCNSEYTISFRIKKKCKFCKKEFSAVPKKVKFCCHKCSVIYYLKYGNKKSKPEKIVGSILRSLGIKFISSFTINDKVFDYYLPSKNLLIEVDGIYWHARNKSNINEIQKKNLINDNIKNRLSVEMGYNLLRVWEDEIKNVPEYIHQQERWLRPCVG